MPGGQAPSGKNSANHAPVRELVSELLHRREISDTLEHPFGGLGSFRLSHMATDSFVRSSHPVCGIKPKVKAWFNPLELRSLCILSRRDHWHQVRLDYQPTWPESVWPATSIRRARRQRPSIVAEIPLTITKDPSLRAIPAPHSWPRDDRLIS
jgi:hypothetical protein